MSRYSVPMIYPKSSITGKAKFRLGWLLAFGLSAVGLACGIAFAEQNAGAAGEQAPAEAAEQDTGEVAEQAPVDKAKHPVDEVVLEALQKTPDIDKGQALYYQCALCHTPEGWGSPNGRYPQIAGQHKSVILKQMADIHKGNRDNPTMIPFTPPLFQKGPQALADIAAYIEQLPMVPNNSIGTGMRLGRGKTLYEENCKECHGENGEGDAREFYPRIQGQHFRYLQRQMEWIKIGKRRNADPKMMEQLEGFTHVDIAAIVDYVSRMQPDKDMVADHMDWRNPDFRRDFRRIPRSP